MYDQNHNKRDLMEDPEKGVSQATNPLAKLWRLMLRELKVNPWRWKQLMELHVEDPRSGVPSTPKDRSSARGNLNKELRKPKITWGTFVKGVLLLNPVKVRFETHMTWSNGKTTVHGVDVLGRAQRGDSMNEVSAMIDQFDEILGTDRLGPPSMELLLEHDDEPNT